VKAVARTAKTKNRYFGSLDSQGGEFRRFADLNETKIAANVKNDHPKRTRVKYPG
jgi:hypothetical protein